MSQSKNNIYALAHPAANFNPSFEEPYEERLSVNLRPYVGGVDVVVNIDGQAIISIPADDIPQLIDMLKLASESYKLEVLQ